MPRNCLKLIYLCINRTIEVGLIFPPATLQAIVHAVLTTSEQNLGAIGSTQSYHSITEAGQSEGREDSPGQQGLTRSEIWVISKKRFFKKILKSYFEIILIQTKL